MNGKLLKYREKFRKNTEKISVLTEENKRLTPMIRELEDREIIGIVRGHNMTPDALEEMFGPIMEENEKLRQSADAEAEDCDVMEIGDHGEEQTGTEETE